MDSDEEATEYNPNMDPWARRINRMEIISRKILYKVYNNPCSKCIVNACCKKRCPPRRAYEVKVMKKGESMARSAWNTFWVGGTMSFIIVYSILWELFNVSNFWFGL